MPKPKPKSKPKSKPKPPKVTRRLKKALCPFFYVIRACRRNFTSDNSFKYPKSGPVQAPVYCHEPCCGFGLHAWPHPCFIGKSTPCWYEATDASKLVFMIIRVPRTYLRRPNYIQISREKLKFHFGEVVLTGPREQMVRTFNELVLPSGLTVDGRRS